MLAWAQAPKNLSRRRLRLASEPDSAFWLRLPSTPAVYIFADASGKSLYIGKSIHLRTRIRQHYKSAVEGEKQAHFWPQSKTLSFCVVGSELEAVLLEARLIRLYQPPFNIISKDDKSLIYIAISRDNYPQVSLARKTELTGKEAYFGPFMSAWRTQHMLKLSRRIVHFCANPPHKGGQHRPCFYYHLGLCSGACVGKVTAAAYRHQIGLLKRFLNGQMATVGKALLREIKFVAKEENYRLAATLKKQYEALTMAKISQHIGGTFLESNPEVDHQLGRLVQVLGEVGVAINPERLECFDMATLQQQQTVGSMAVFNLGVADKSQYRKFRVRQIAGGDPHNMAEVVKRRFRHHDWPKPGLLILDGGKGQLSVVGRVVPKDVPLVALAKKEEVIFVPQAGSYREIRLSLADPASKLLRRIRDEAHRFATGYHKTIRKREFL